MGLGGGGSGLMRTKNLSFCENSKKKNFFFFLGGGGRGERLGGGTGGGVGLGGQGGCERRTEVFVKIQKKKIGGGGRVGPWGVRVGGVSMDVNEELKFL